MTKKLSSNEIRSRFLEYFKDHGHQIVPSSSLIPANDPTLLFVNAGMVQFKDTFLGTEKRDYTTATSSQRCVRAGGKHNDLERVGYTARHHTFFEMLGNFSFGDYFKEQAIKYAWEFLTKELGLPEEKLWVTVYQDDQEAEDIWLKTMKIDPNRFSRCGEADNFWSMGPTGPCGPCTEIFYDHGPEIPGGPPGSPDEDGDRYIEIWNLVFMQYDRAADGTLNPLPKPSVDTGMGLERISAVIQNVHNNYDTDTFKHLIKAAAKLTSDADDAIFSLRVIADHIRSCSFLIIDGVTPSNEGRGYVLRRIIRRALRHGNKLGQINPFFFMLVAPLAEAMGEAYPELNTKREYIEKVLKQEEEQFGATLSQGLKVFDQIVTDMNGNTIPGELVFKLYDTYGFPADLTADIARERNLKIDLEGFETEMSKQRQRSRQSSQFKTEYTVAKDIDQPTEFTGHKDMTKSDTQETGKVIALYREGKFVDELNKGEKGSIILDKTPFYAESGGQVGDQGVLRINEDTFFKVADTIKQGHMHLHLGKLDKGCLKIGDEVIAEIDVKRRAATVLNHTATHVLHKVLKTVLGEHAMQKGSLVAPDRLRFDFTHQSALTKDELKKVEDLVNAEIQADHKAKVEISTPDEAIKAGAVALFGEKYGNKVRVVHFGDSVELCGGTHADSTGAIGVFKITSESGVAAGIRRIEAVTGEGAAAWEEKQQQEQAKIAAQQDERINKIKESIHALETQLKSANPEFLQSYSVVDDTLEKAEQIIQLEKIEISLKDQLAGVYSAELAQQAKEISGIKVLATVVEGLDGKALRSALDHLKADLGKAIIVLATKKGKKVGLVCGVTDNLVDRFSAREIVNQVAEQVGGRGGGRADMAEAGGNKPEALATAIESVYTVIERTT